MPMPEGGTAARSRLRALRPAPLDVQAGQHGPLDVILALAGEIEDRKHRIADELDHHAVAFPDRGGAFVVERVEHVDDVLLRRRLRPSRCSRGGPQTARWPGRPPASCPIRGEKNVSQTVQRLGFMRLDPDPRAFGTGSTGDRECVIGTRMFCQQPLQIVDRATVMGSPSAKGFRSVRRSAWLDFSERVSVGRSTPGRKLSLVERRSQTTLACPGRFRLAASALRLVDGPSARSIEDRACVEGIVLRGQEENERARARP